MKKTILFALSALLVGACAKEDPEEKEIFPDVPPRGFHFDKRPFYLLESTYDAVAFSKSDLRLYLTSKEGKELYIQMDMAHLGKKIPLDKPEKGIVPPNQPWEFKAPDDWRIYGEEGHTAEVGSYLKITQVGQEKRFALEYRIAYKGHTAEGNETVLFVERILPGLYYKGAKIELKTPIYTKPKNGFLQISLSDAKNITNNFTFELSEEHLGKRLPLDIIDSEENYWAIESPNKRYEGKAGHLAPLGSWMRVTQIGNHYKLQFFISNDFKGNL